MRWAFLFSLFLFLSGCIKISHDAQNLYVRIDLPSTNKDKTPIDDLEGVQLIMMVDGREIVKNYHAESPNGNYAIHDTIPMAATSYAKIDAWAYAYDYSGNKSEQSNIVHVLGNKPAPLPAPSPSPF